MTLQCGPCDQEVPRELRRCWGEHQSSAAVPEAAAGAEDKKQPQTVSARAGCWCEEQKGPRAGETI